MVLHLARALVVLIAACVAPSLAHAHAGHAHSALAAHSMPLTADVAAVALVAGHQEAAQAAATIVVQTEVSRATPAPTDRIPSGCGSHCCNGMAGMTCCTAALTADVSTAPVSLSSYAFLFLHAAVLLGLVPEALPKPPKSFA
jgi:hypothetical protein